MSAPVTGAQIIAKKLAAIGCEASFGIPGGEVLAIMQALDEEGVRFHLTKHENVAGFMAEGAWHASGAPGVLLATLGPGVANAVNVVANAMQDRVPLIFITGCVDHAVGERYTHQVFDHQALLRPIVKGTFRASPGVVGAVMDKAVTLALEGQPGPVHIDVPIGVAENPSNETVLPPPPARETFAPLDGPVLQEARDLLAGAERPIAVAGVDAVNEEAGPKIAEFCRRFGIPLVTSYKGKGLLDEGDPLSLGGAGLSPKADDVIKPLFEKSDLILLLGYDPIEMRIGWRDPWPGEKNVIEITPVPRLHAMHSVTHTLLGALAPTLDSLEHAVAAGGKTWPGGEIEKARADLAAMFAPPADGFGPARVFQTLREVMPPRTLATADSGAHRILLSQMWPVPAPRLMLQSSALCTMGCAVPLAAGYKLMEQEAPVIAFIGDAGMEMILGDLATLRDQRLPVIICVLVDESLALIELKQRTTQRPNLGVDFSGTDFPAVAAAMGGYGVWVDDPDTLKAEAEAALTRESFTLLACRIGHRPYDGTF